jgi:hypothetical protein
MPTYCEEESNEKLLEDQMQSNRRPGAGYRKCGVVVSQTLGRDDLRRRRRVE